MRVHVYSGANQTGPILSAIFYHYINKQTPYAHIYHAIRTVTVSSAASSHDFEASRSDHVTFTARGLQADRGPEHGGICGGQRECIESCPGIPYI